jgi:hypothetical protein
MIRTSSLNTPIFNGFTVGGSKNVGTLANGTYSSDRFTEYTAVLASSPARMAGANRN